MISANESGALMLKLLSINALKAQKTIAKSALVVGFASMSGAALVNGLTSLLVSGGVSTGRTGFLLALGASTLAAMAAGLLTRLHNRDLAKLESLATAIANGEVAVALNREGPNHTMHEQLNLIAEAQLRRIEEFHKLLEDSRIREERLYEALDALDDEIAVYDANGMLVSVNKAFNKHCNSAGITVGPGMVRRDIIKAMSLAPVNDVPIDEREMWVDHQFQMRDLALSRKTPVDSIQRDGRHLRFTMIETPTKNQIEIVTDITESVVLLQDAEKLRREAEAASERKNVTIERLKDNIRTPMTGVLAAAELLDATSLDTNQRGKLDVIRRSSGALLGVVQEMIELNRGSSDLEGVSLAPEAELKLPSHLPVDPIQLVQANLRVSRRAVLIVRSEDLLGRLTALLKQDDIQTIALDTVDLAMSLIADGAHDAVKTDFVMTDDVSALSVLTNWAMTVLPVNRPVIIDLNKVMTDGFAATAPIQTTKAADEPQETHSRGAENTERPIFFGPGTKDVALSKLDSGQRLVAVNNLHPKRKKIPLDVMVVEDNDVNQIVYDQLLSKTGYQYLIVSSGEEGINTAEGEKPRLILMDISMPGLNGLEATRRLRASQHDKRPFIVGMTSHVLSGDREKCISAGMDDYALKPTSSGPLRTQIAEWLGTGNREALAV